jgi:hypothetical protein
MCGPEDYNDVHNFDEALEWATTWLVGSIVTAVVLDKDGVLAAWEKDTNGPLLVAKGPRPFPGAVAA